MFKSQCKEANQKLDALLKVAYQLDLAKGSDIVLGLL